MKDISGKLPDYSGLVLPKNPDDSALNLHIVRLAVYGLHQFVSGLKANLMVLSVDFFQGYFLLTI